MGMLTDRRLGATADWMRKRTGRSVVAQARQAAVRVGRVERTLAFDLHIPQGVWLQGTGADQYIRWDERGWLQVLSPEDTLDINKTPWGRKHALGLDLLGGVIPTGCDCCLEDATFSVVIDPGQPVRLSFVEPCSIVLRLGCDPCGFGVVGVG